MNLVNIDKHQLVAERHPNLVLKFSYLKNLEDTDSFNMRGVYRGKESEQVKVGIDVTVLITHINHFVVNGKPVTASLDQR